MKNKTADNQRQDEQISEEQRKSLQSGLVVNRQTMLFDQGQQKQSQFYSFQANRQSLQQNQDPQINAGQTEQKQANIKENKQIILDVKQKPQEKKEQSIPEQVESQNKMKQFDELQAKLSQIPEQTMSACQKISEQIITKSNMEQYRKILQERIMPIYTEFCKAYQNLLGNIQIEESINTYAHILVRHWDQQMFFQHFVQNKYLSILMNKVRQFKYANHIVKVVFGCLEYLLKGLGTGNSKNSNKQQQFIYLLVMISKQGFITEAYKFNQSQDWAYYAHFMKLLVRIINQADKAEQLQIRKTISNQKLQEQSSTFTFSPEKQAIQFTQHVPMSKLKSRKSWEYEQLYSKYLSIFFNQKCPQFPLILKLLYFYKWPDTILQTSVKLCLLQLSNHPNRTMQKYLLNFPFVTFYLLYCSKISDNIQKYMVLGSARSAVQKQSQRQEILYQQIISDVKFMQDFLRIQDQQISPTNDIPPPLSSFKTNNIQQHLNMYVNAFFYYVGRGFYQQFCKYINESNTNGLINGMLLLIKILRMNTILKIKLGFEEMLHKYINCDLFDYLRGKRERLDNEKYWLFDQCEAIIKQHTQNILYHNDQQQTHNIKPAQSEQKYNSNPNFSIRFSEENKQTFVSEVIHNLQIPTTIAISNISQNNNNNSGKKQKPKKPAASYTSMLFKTVRSYIPTTNSNWIYHEMKKISSVLGLNVQLNKQIQHTLSANYNNQGSSTSYYKNSFLHIIDEIQENHLNGNNSMVLKSKESLLSRHSSPIKINQLFLGIFNFANKGVVKHSNSGSKNGQYDNRKGFQDNSQQLMYYYLVLLCSIKDQTRTDIEENKNGDHHLNIIDNINKNQQKINLQQMWQLLKITKKCKSLKLVGMMYWYVKIIDYQLSQKSDDFKMTDFDGYDSIELQQGSRERENIRVSEKDKEKEKQQTIANQLLQTYIHTMSKLTYYILTQGWQTFTKHIKQIKKVIWNKKTKSKDQKVGKAQNPYSYQDCNMRQSTQFTNDIFRDIQCDIVYFVILRYIFGTRNSRQQLSQQIDGTLENKDIISKQIKVPCRLTNSEGQQVYLIMDGQYIKFMTADDVLITKKPLSINSFNVYYQEKEQENNSKLRDHQIRQQIKQKAGRNRNAVFELVDKSMGGECFTVYFSQIPIRQYIGKEIKWRKKITMDIQMSLRTMRFDIED